MPPSSLAHSLNCRSRAPCSPPGDPLGGARETGGHQHDVVEPDGIGRSLFALRHRDDPVARKTARGRQAVGRKDGFGIQQRAIGLEMQHARRGVDFAHRWPQGATRRASSAIPAASVRADRPTRISVSVTRMSPPSMKCRGRRWCTICHRARAGAVPFPQPRPAATARRGA